MLHTANAFPPATTSASSIIQLEESMGNLCMLLIKAALSGRMFAEVSMTEMCFYQSAEQDLLCGLTDFTWIA